jgi:hypothetical protein
MAGRAAAQGWTGVGGDAVGRRARPLALRALVLLGLGAGCAASAPARVGTPLTTAPGAEAGGAETPGREALPRWALSSPDGLWTGQVESVEAPTYEQIGGDTKVTLSLGAPTDMLCRLFSRAPGTAALLREAVKVAGAGPEDEVLDARAVAVVPVGQHPAVFLEVQILRQSKEGPRQGELQLMVYDDEAVSMACLSMEKGHDARFRRVTTSLAGSLRKAGVTPQVPRYEELFVLQVAGRPVGFERRELVESAGGHTLELAQTVLLTPGSGDDFVVESSVSGDLRDAKGVLVRTEYNDTRNGKTHTELSMRHLEGLRYRYEGQVRGESLKGEFTSRAPLTTDFQMRQPVRSLLLPGAVAELQAEAYLPSYDPSGPTPVTVRRKAGSERGLRWELGARAFDAQVDLQGHVEHFVVPLGDAELRQERVASRGSL